MYKLNSEQKHSLIKKLKIFFRDLAIILMVGLLITYFFSLDLKALIDNIVPIMAYSAFMGLTLWKGNEILSVWVHKKADWKGKPERKFLAGVILIIVYTLVAIYFVQFVFYFVTHGWDSAGFESPRFREVILLLGVTFIIAFSMNMREFIIEKRDNLIREEKLKTEIVKLEYETLKNQVNPHFLFNSLNTLTSLVSENDDAVKFIKNLADVYRYVLDQKDKEVVSLSDEIQFVSAFLYLHKIRFGDNLQLHIDIKSMNRMVVPLAIQMLVENAIKHNIISEAEPLKITIYEEQDYLIVENNLQLKSVVHDSSKIGLKNIQSRYAYLTDKLLIINSLSDNFIVKVPLLEITKK